MIEHRECRHSVWQADQMLALVRDVGSYQEFLPWCVGSRVIERTRAERETLLAQLSIGYRSVHQSYVSRVLIDDAARTVEVTQYEGPFRELSNSWRFTPRESGCEIDFHLRFEFRSAAMQMLISGVFARAARTMVSSFEARAARLYG